MSEAFFTVKRPRTQEIMKGMLDLFSQSNSKTLITMTKEISKAEHKPQAQVKLELAQKIHNTDNLYRKVEKVYDDGGNFIGYMYFISINILRNKMRKHGLIGVKKQDVMDRPKSVVPLSEDELPNTPSVEDEYITEETMSHIFDVFTEGQVDFLLGKVSLREIAEEECTPVMTWYNRLRKCKKIFIKKYGHLYSEYKKSSK